MLDTTEMYEVGKSSFWTFVAPLPVGMEKLRGVNLDNRIFMFGKLTFCVRRGLRFVFRWGCAGPQ